MSNADALEWVRQAGRLFDEKKLDEAARLAQQALQHDPKLARARQVMGLVRIEHGALADGMAQLQTALALQPDLVPSHIGLGRGYSYLGDTERALQCFEAALRLEPSQPFAHFNRALTLLKRGNFHEGWLDYEWRFQVGQVQRPEMKRPRWDGSPLNGRALMISTEQGMGDVLQFIRLLPRVRRQETRIVFACQKALHALLRPLADVDEWFPIDTPGNITFDLHAPLLSLPGLLGVDEASIPAAVPYLPVDADRVEAWRGRIESLPGLKVGIVWQGSPTLQGDRFRSIPLARFAPLAAVAGITLVSLQKGAGVEQIDSQRAAVPLATFDDLDRDAPFVDTAAVLQHLDLVITIDSAVAHLAGGLGRPVWTLLSTASDWRWLEGRADSPWYPTMRLFRQTTLGDWDPVFEQVIAGLPR
jgi:hypothetical protein